MRNQVLFVLVIAVCACVNSAYSQTTETVSSTFNLKLINKEEVLKDQQEELKKLQAELTRQLDAIRQQMIDSKQLSENTELNVKPVIAKTIAADGSEEVNLKLQVGYETKKEKSEIKAGVSSKTDDFASGAYKAVSSKACMMACNFLKEKAENELADYFEPGGRVTIKITGENDAVGDENRRISIDLTIHGAFNKIVNPEVVTKNKVDSLSDVDKNIPQTTTKRDNYLALIIANEKYENWSPVSFANNDGKTFKEYCIKTLGIPESQVKYIENPADKRIIVYYAGHGYPVKVGDNTESYLIPVDCNNVTSGKYSYSLSDIYNRLGSLGVGSLTFFLDACFSGSDRSGAQLVEGTRGVSIAPKANTLSGNTVVFSAVEKDQTAHPYRAKRHGIFTYYLLKALQSSEGDIAYLDLSKSIESNVVKTMLRDNKGLVQNPTVNASSAMRSENKWGELKF